MSVSTSMPPIPGDTFVFCVCNLLHQSQGWRSLMLPYVEMWIGAGSLG